ncbi:hypothetical protein PGT21_030380 [Puccinia graminis f. sp. tritici]|uniref:Uncharacterized protein n=1 Tax=Puccinia graminis f. sp. tritici TaxID=56615 RepID=A0A5B0PCB5_PUCGR|nr:hypothetical protein PGT21_030380 [Puccinia graminis f. sp. tritici]KAA1099235.1 hypothetical protein PGTUg99_023883 [Puccinia graminis f. sp. tritici]
MSVNKTKLSTPNRSSSRSPTSIIKKNVSTKVAINVIDLAGPTSLSPCFLAYPHHAAFPLANLRIPSKKSNPIEAETLSSSSTLLPEHRHLNLVVVVASEFGPVLPSYYQSIPAEPSSIVLGISLLFSPSPLPLPKPCHCLQTA